MTENLLIRAMRRPELDVLVGWAAREGWNPGRYDADIFWKSDPEGFIAAEIDGELIGGGSIVSYQQQFGFMGFFIIRPEFRGRGLGTRLWFARRDKLQARLKSSAAIGMDGVFEMQPFYARGGFEFAHREIRFEGIGRACSMPESLTPLADAPFNAVLEYDTAHFPAERPHFLKAWITQPESRALGVMDGGQLRGYGVIRRCENGFKIGPLFADKPGIALDLFNGLSDHAASEAIFIDVPEINDAALQIVMDKKMKEVFGCARMYFGHKPVLPDAHIYGVTTFELG
ncbi:MAG: GNAT family N-acetyltransferase [Proteobacteria bacterium]|nr:GNAT family N-acetyltransferase [Pseudomonadota bacterium]